MSVPERIHYTVESFAANGRSYTPTVTVVNDCGYPSRETYAHADTPNPIPRGHAEGPRATRTVAEPKRTPVPSTATINTKALVSRVNDIENLGERRQALADALIDAAERSGFELTYAQARGWARSLVPEPKSVAYARSRAAPAKREPPVLESMRRWHEAEQYKRMQADINQLNRQIDAALEPDQERKDRAFAYAKARINAGEACSWDEAMLATEPQRYGRRYSNPSGQQIREHAVRQINKGIPTSFAEARQQLVSM